MNTKKSNVNDISTVLNNLVLEFRVINAADFLQGNFNNAEHTKQLLIDINKLYSQQWPHKKLKEVIEQDFHVEAFIIIADILTALHSDKVSIDGKIIYNIIFLVCVMQLCKDVEQVKTNPYYKLGWYIQSDICDLINAYTEKYSFEIVIKSSAKNNLVELDYQDYFDMRHKALWKLIHQICPRPNNMQYSMAALIHENTGIYHEVLVMRDYYQAEQPVMWDNICRYAEAMLPKVTIDEAFARLDSILDSANEEKQKMSYLTPQCFYVWVDRNALDNHELDQLVQTRIELLYKSGYFKKYKFAEQMFDDWPITKQYLLKNKLCEESNHISAESIESILENDRSKSAVIELICCHCNHAILSKSNLAQSLDKKFRRESKALTIINFFRRYKSYDGTRKKSKVKNISAFS